MMSLIDFIKVYKAYIKERRKQEITAILQECKEERSFNRLDSGGWSKNRDKKAMAKIPVWMTMDKEYGKYFDINTPHEDRRKEFYSFLDRMDKEYGNFRTYG